MWPVTGFIVICVLVALTGSMGTATGQSGTEIQNDVMSESLRELVKVLRSPADNSSMEGIEIFTTNCLNCICMVEGCQREVGRCKMDRGSLSCGPFQIKLNYWIDCGKPGGDWQTCAKQMACSVRCVQAYMHRWGKRCTGGREPTCQDYAKIHNGGPHGCKKPLAGYWARVKACCVRKAGGCG